MEMEDPKLVIARRHLQFVQRGKSREDALAALQDEGVISPDLTHEQCAQLLQEFASTLQGYLERDVQRTLR